MPECTTTVPNCTVKWSGQLTFKLLFLTSWVPKLRARVQRLSKKNVKVHREDQGRKALRPEGPRGTCLPTPEADGYADPIGKATLEGSLGAGYRSLHGVFEGWARDMLCRG